MRLNTIKEVNIKAGMRVLVRFDYNVPVQKGAIVNDFRIKKSRPTLDMLIKAGARVIAVSHIDNEEGSTLRPVFEYLSQFYKVTFVSSVDEAIRESEEIGNGEILLVENLRKDNGEKENSDEFVRKLSKLGDIYVNDAFSSAHRRHASIVGVPKFLPAYAGILFEEEVRILERALSPEHPFLFILAGAKFETKLPLIEKYLNLADNLFIAGAIANDFFKCKGYEVGVSKVSGEKCNLSDALWNEKIILPIDVVVYKDGKSKIKKPDEVLPEELIVDAGPETIKSLEGVINDSKIIVWNGPLGNYEMGFGEGTKLLAKKIAESQAFSIIGGGDTTAVLSDMISSGKFGFVSTGGGATIEFLEKGTLPGVEVLKSKNL